MQAWLKLSFFLCFLGFLKEIRPSENFYYEYLTGKWWNCSAQNVQQVLMPISTYTNLMVTVIMFLVTDLFRYKPFIVLMAAAGTIVWGFLAWGSTLLHLQILMVFYGLFFAMEVAYFTYIYAKVPKEYYLQVTSHTRAALIFGHGISGILSQILVQFELLNYQQLNYITFSAMVFSITWALMLPSVKTSVYFHNQTNTNNTFTEKYTSAFKLMKHHFLASYSQWYVIKWSIWWSLSTCGFIHTQLYMQPLWSLIVARTNGNLYNGVAETVMTVAGFASTVTVGFIKVDWRKYGDLAKISCSVLSAVFLIISSQTENVFVSYAAYAGFGGVYYFVITIATSEVAKYILEDSYGLVFGLNTLVFLILQSLVMLVFVTGDLGWALKPREQHVAYGLYHGGIALLFILNAIFKYVKKLWFRPVSHINNSKQSVETCSEDII